MCNLSKGIEERAFEKGENTGRLTLLNEMVRDGELTQEQASKKQICLRMISKSSIIHIS